MKLTRLKSRDKINSNIIVPLITTNDNAIKLRTKKYLVTFVVEIKV